MSAAGRHALAACLLAVALTQAAAEVSMGKTYAGDATYYGFRTRGFGHCSYHFHGFGDSTGYAGTPLAINAAQYTGTSICGQCVKFRGVGQGAGGNPVASGWQSGFICDQCPECRFGDIDQQKGGDGRWKVEWYPVQCPVGSSTFRYGFQGGNPWYKKLMVANARVPLRNVNILNGGSWQPLTKTIDNYWEFHGDTGRAWPGGCAKVQITSILGDTVEDSVCCTTGTCTGKGQFPCKSSMPSDDGCSGAQGPPSINTGGIAPARGQTGPAAPQQGSSQVAQEAGAAVGNNNPKAARFGRNDLAAARLDVSNQGKQQQGQGRGQGQQPQSQQQQQPKKKGEACGDKNGKWGGGVTCEQGLSCKQGRGGPWVCAP